jgi:hypothetical protein
VSTATLVDAVDASRAGAVVVVSHLNGGRQRAVQSLRATTERGVAVFYAGNAFTSPRSRRNLPGVYLGTRLREACEQIGATLDGTVTQGAA